MDTRDEYYIEDIESRQRDEAKEILKTKSMDELFELADVYYNDIRKYIIDIILDEKLYLSLFDE